MITKFNKFTLNETMISHDTNELHSGSYLSLERLENGNLKISLTEEGKEKIAEDDISDSEFWDYFEDITGNSGLVYFNDISELGIMMEAPGITIGYYYNDDGEYTDEGNEDWSEVFYYGDSAIRDFTEELKNNGEVIFQTSGVLTPEEFDEFKLNKTANKFNL